MVPKWFLALNLLAVALLGMLCAKLAQRKGGRLMALAEAFVSGGLLNAALVHLLAENMETLEGAMAGEGGEPYPLAPLICGLGALVAHFVEGCMEPLLQHALPARPAGQVVGRKLEMQSVGSTSSPDEDGSREPPNCETTQAVSLAGPLLLLALSLHSLLEGMSLGATKEEEAMHVFVPIIAHKGMAAFTLGINWNGLRYYFLALIFFALLTPIGVFIGATVEGSVTGSVLLLLSAGTFLYVGLVETMPGVRKPWLPSFGGRVAQMGVCSPGFAAMGVLAEWV